MPTTAETLPVPDTILQKLGAWLIDVKQLRIKKLYISREITNI
jgi:hypothetical protein